MKYLTTNQEKQSELRAALLEIRPDAKRLQPAVLRGDRLVRASSRRGKHPRAHPHHPDGSIMASSHDGKK